MSKMERGEQFRRNLKHTVDFLDAAIDEPDKLASISDGTSVVFMPDDDAELRTANTELLAGAVAIVVPSPGIAATGTVTAPAITPPAIS